MTTPDDQAEVDKAQKAQQRAMWALGDYAGMAADVIPGLGEILVRACAIAQGDRVLDVAAGSGNAAIPAALTGASVVASDLTPELLAAGEKQAALRGAHLEWTQADAESLPFDDGEFDIVMSCVGVMFAPHHQASADELIRVCRPGGKIGLLSWTPEGFLGQMLATMRPYAPPHPPGAQPPPLWGNEDHVRALLGDRVTEITARRETISINAFTSPQALRDDFKTRFGPTINVYRNIADEPERTAALDKALIELAQRNDHGVDTTMLDWEYLLLTAQKKE